MLRFFARRLKELHEAKGDERGFTLIELLIVIIIIGILAAIAIPTFLAQRDKAVIATCKSDTRNAAEAAVLAAADDPNGSFLNIDSLDDLEAQGFNQTEGYTTEPDPTGGFLLITTTCPDPPGGTATWTTEDQGGGLGDVRGEVVYNTP